MIELYEKYLEELLLQAGMNSEICKSIQELKNYAGSYVGGVVLDKDHFEVERKNKVYIEKGVQKKRIKKFNRTTEFLVIIGEHTSQACDEIFAKFLSLIDKGIYDLEGNYVEIEIGEAEWLRDKDSILVSSVVVQVGISFKGGIYKDFEYKSVIWKGDGEYVKES